MKHVHATRRNSNQHDNEQTGGEDNKNWDSQRELQRGVCEKQVCAPYQRQQTKQQQQQLTTKIPATLSQPSATPPTSSTPPPPQSLPLLPIAAVSAKQQHHQQLQSIIIIASDTATSSKSSSMLDRQLGNIIVDNNFNDHENDDIVGVTNNSNTPPFDTTSITDATIAKVATTTNTITTSAAASIVTTTVIALPSSITSPNGNTTTNGSLHHHHNVHNNLPGIIVSRSDADPGNATNVADISPYGPAPDDVVRPKDLGDEDKAIVISLSGRRSGGSAGGRFCSGDEADDNLGHCRYSYEPCYKQTNLFNYQNRMLNFEGKNHYQTTTLNNKLKQFQAQTPEKLNELLITHLRKLVLV